MHVQAKFKGIPFVSQKAIYREIIQNLTLTQPLPTCAEAVSPVETPAGSSSSSCPAPAAAAVFSSTGGGPQPTADARALPAARMRPASAQCSAAGRAGAATTPTSAAATQQQQQQRGGQPVGVGRRGSVARHGHAPGPGKCSIM